jgi:osmotically-inducible protein OsmY
MSVEVRREGPLSRHVATVAEARFRANSHTALRGISCKTEGGTIVLEGRLESFYHTQLAQEIVANIEGVVQVVNHIEVVGRAT